MQGKVGAHMRKLEEFKAIHKLSFRGTSSPDSASSSSKFSSDSTSSSPSASFISSSASLSFYTKIFQSKWCTDYPTLADWHIHLNQLPRQQSCTF
ncbi:hypothetical protein CASFOL_011926 [Castilleja foliolosa]|uniref:Uncharacterized protein n=1 Tax=Castilleja foliolosa TaxID=1961234 RepID=A0ABD3DQ56_9LAMI